MKKAGQLWRDGARPPRASRVNVLEALALKNKKVVSTEETKAGESTGIAHVAFADVVIVCALHTPELEFIRKTGTEAWRIMPSRSDNTTTYYSTNYRTNKGRRLSVVAAAPTQMGLSAAAVLGAKMILHFTPNLVVMVGIAAGAKRDSQGYGDIIAADCTFDYGSGKITTLSDGTLHFSPDPNPIGIQPRLRDLLKRWAGDQESLERIREAYTDAKPEGRIQLHVGPLASGAAVLGHGGPIADVLEHWRKLVGVEMEAYGVHMACRDTLDPPPAFLCFKSICDFADRKHDDWQRFAAFTAAEFGHRFITESWEEFHLDHLRSKADKQDFLGNTTRIDLEGALLAEMQQASESKRWDEVVKLGSALSRPLWLTGRNSLRIRIGKLVETAAALSHDHEAQAAALIDDLGWTSVSLAEYDEGERYIKHGIRVARKSHTTMLICKGYRHLSGLAFHRKDFGRAKRYLTEAMKVAPKIRDKGERHEMVASFHYLLSRFLAREGQFKKALAELGKAEKMYAEARDDDRRAKCYRVRGEIYLAMKDPDSAKDAFREGIAAAQAVSRKDSIVNNLVGCAAVALLENDRTGATRYYGEAASVAREMGKQQLVDELLMKAREAGKAGHGRRD